jgi:segregation and condensation protein A
MATKSYEVHLEIFEGPLDLLLHLIKRDDLDIDSIPISKITHEYLEYLELMKELNLEIAGDFLVMAATLMQIKARSLLPSQPEEGGDESGPDPRTELVAKLQEYQKYKEAAKFLQGRSHEFSNIFYRGTPSFSEKDKNLNLRIFDLLSTLREVLDRADDDGRIVEGEEFPVDKKMDKILHMLKRRSSIKLIDVFVGERRRRAILACFLALLELIKVQKIFARQDSSFGDILIYKKEVPQEPLDQVWPEGEPSPRSEGGNVSDKSPTEAVEMPRIDAAGGSALPESAAPIPAPLEVTPIETVDVAPATHADAPVVLPKHDWDPPGPEAMTSEPLEEVDEGDVEAFEFSPEDYEQGQDAPVAGLEPMGESAAESVLDEPVLEEGEASLDSEVALTDTADAIGMPAHSSEDLGLAPETPQPTVGDVEEKEDVDISLTDNTSVIEMPANSSEDVEPVLDAPQQDAAPETDETIIELPAPTEDTPVEDARPETPPLAPDTMRPEIFIRSESDIPESSEGPKHGKENDPSPEGTDDVLRDTRIGTNGHSTEPIEIEESGREEDEHED